MRTSQFNRLATWSWRLYGPNWEPECIEAGPSQFFLVDLVSFFLCRPHNRSRLAFRENKPSDVISTLVSIYDSKDLFVKELQVFLAQRLLTLTKDDTERVERELGFSFFLLFDCPFMPLSRSFLSIHDSVYLNCFPIFSTSAVTLRSSRFNSEKCLRVCEVMLRDMTDSKRRDGHVKSQKAVS